MRNSTKIVLPLLIDGEPGSRKINICIVKIPLNLLWRRLEDGRKWAYSFYWIVLEWTAARMRLQIFAVDVQEQPQNTFYIVFHPLQSSCEQINSFTKSRFSILDALAGWKWVSERPVIPQDGFIPHICNFQSLLTFKSRSLAVTKFHTPNMARIALNSSCSLWFSDLFWFNIVIQICFDSILSLLLLCVIWFHKMLILRAMAGAAGDGYRREGLAAPRRRCLFTSVTNGTKEKYDNTNSLIPSIVLQINEENKYHNPPQNGSARVPYWQRCTNHGIPAMSNTK